MARRTVRQDRKNSCRNHVTTLYIHSKYKTVWITVRSVPNKVSASAKGPPYPLFNDAYITTVPAIANIIANQFYLHAPESQSKIFMQMHTFPFSIS